MSFLPPSPEPVLGRKSVSVTPSEVVEAPMSETESAPNSHASSFDESLVSQSSTREPLSREIAQSKTATFHGITTPPTTMSNLSSQDPPVHDLRSSAYLPSIPRDSTARLQPFPLDIKGSLQPYVQSTASETAGHIANKRLANGEIKYGEKSRSHSPINPERYGHSRSASANSKDSPIRELSNQLRTRLSYAMVKVQNGWESHNIDEIEKLSQQGSPILTMPRLQHLDDPSQANHRPEPIKFANAHHANLPPDLTRSPPQSRGGPKSGRGTPQTNSPVHSPRSVLGSRTYESFWREHSMNIPAKPFQAPVQPSPAPFLAPPVDILPRRRAEPKNLDTQRLLATTTSRSDGPARNDKAISSLDLSPATPGKQRPAIRTASQNAAMEKDAVETLLFMSSPGNSGHYPPPRPLDTPLQSNFPRPTKQVGFADASGGRYVDNLDQSPMTPVKPYLFEKGLSKPGQRLTGADLDRYLDQMPEDDSSSDDNDDVNSRPHSQPYVHH